VINFYVINSVTRKIVKESGCASKEQAKLIRDKYNEGSGHITYCVTRSGTNEASKPPHGRPCSYRGLT
jgi:hypothetical protein